jgi:hypothetical protein
VCLEKEFSDCKRASKPSVRTDLRIILYVESIYPDVLRVTREPANAGSLVA